MPKCTKCGKRGLFLKLTKEGFCLDCVKAIEEEQRIAEQKRLKQEKERREREAREKEREDALQRKYQQYDEMLSNITTCELIIADEPAKIIFAKDQKEIAYSSITKKTPREKLGNFVVIDTETTGLKLTCEIIDIAAIRFRNYKPVEKVSMLLSSKRPIPAEATAINGITNEMVSGQPCFQEIAKSLVDFIGKDNIVGHNLPFDLSFIIRYGADVTQDKRKYYDTLEIARKTIKKAKQKWDKEFEFYYVDLDEDGVENYKLETLCDWYGIINTQSHRAENDALATGFLLQKLAEDRE